MGICIKEELKKIFNINELSYFSERKSVVEIKLELLKLPNKSELTEFMDYILENDNLRITIGNYLGNYIVIKTEIDIYNKYDEYYEDTINDTNFKMSIQIDKNIESGQITIYNLNEFISNLKCNNLNSIIEYFNYLKSTNSFLHFRVLDTDIDDWYTETISFGNNSINNTNINFEKINQLKHLGSFNERPSYEFVNINNNINKLNLAHSDFNIIKNYDGNPLTDIFENMYTTLLKTMDNKIIVQYNIIWWKEK